MVRSETKAVAACVTELLRELSSNPGAHIPSGWESVMDRYLKEPSYGVILVAVQAGTQEVLGVITLRRAEALRTGGVYAIIEEFWVKPPFRSAGLGKQLLANGISFCREEGISRVEVGLPPNHFPGLEKVHSFYARSAFQDVGPRMRLGIAAVKERSFH